ncbi:MAG: UDP-N-acetylmuramate--L-alanine ligase, partial [Anaerolineae bacterium]|nr:UDP-N-acetylmuramate--L-alanine ligase [Anaerolineae bacterium]
MSAIARVLLEQGYVISGSDLRSNALTHELSAAGVTIYQGHAAAHLGDAQVVVRSSAVPDDNPEVAAAHARGIPVLRRHDLLGELMARQTGIAIAGTHGKTTTTALMVHTLMTAGRDPTYIVGGVMQDTGTNAGVGQGGLFVIEADEYDHMFLGLCPTVAVITNIEHDHPDCFPTLDDVIRAFSQFAALVPDSGLLVTCADDPLVAALAAARREAGTPVVTYGLASAAPGQTAPDWVAANLEPDASGGTRFDVIRAGQVLGRVHLNLDGAHNVLNALAVLAAADYVGVSFEQAAAALADFRGTQRRGEV